MKIQWTLAPLAGFTLVGFLWSGEATAHNVAREQAVAVVPPAIAPPALPVNRTAVPR